MKKEDHFGFLKAGNDAEFDKALDSIGDMYGDIFSNEARPSPLFENLAVENNPILDPIDKMHEQVFDPKEVKDAKVYEKVEPPAPGHNPYRAGQAQYVQEDLSES